MADANQPYFDQALSIFEKETDCVKLNLLHHILRMSLKAQKGFSTIFFSKFYQNSLRAKKSEPHLIKDLFCLVTRKKQYVQLHQLLSDLDSSVVANDKKQFIGYLDSKNAYDHDCCFSKLYKRRDKG